MLGMFFETQCTCTLHCSDICVDVLKETTPFQIFVKCCYAHFVKIITSAILIGLCYAVNVTAIGLIGKLLQVKLGCRYNVDQSLEHSWLQVRC